MSRLLSLILLLTSLVLHAFEGELVLQRHNVYDSTIIKYYVKGDLIRMDVFNHQQKLQKSYLINEKENRVYLINARKKLFKEIPYSSFDSKSQAGNPAIIKTGNTKIIDGLKCEQWRVRNTEKNSEITYWVTKDRTLYTPKYLSLITASDNIVNSFSIIPDADGFTPLFIVERTLVRSEKESIKVSSFSAKPLAQSFFTIPKDYQLFQE